MQRRNRTLIITLPFVIVLLAFAIYEYGFLSVRAEFAELKETQSARMKTLEKEVSLIARRSQLEKRLAALTEMRKAEDSKLVTGQTLSLAAANLQVAIKGLITARGGTISSERVEKPEDFGNFKIVSVALDAVVPDTRALSDTLYAVETQTPFLVVREMDVRVRNFSKPKELMVRLKVSGLTDQKK